MCGICGIIDWKRKEIDREAFLAMRDVMSDRGPDDSGVLWEAGVALGHRRLSIIDLSPAGRQPMTNENGRIAIVFNGEIYNFMELREELIAAGHAFRSRTDTEVLLHGYEQWGMEGLLSRIIGMFAFAVWDRDRRQLHLGRDHVGKKPLFYRYSGGRLVFSSDLKSIMIAERDSLQVDEKGLDEYLQYYWISHERCIFKGVEKLAPAHAVTFDGARVHSRRYWAPDYSTKENRSASEWLEGLDYHFRRAVRRRLVSDVPIGAFLSGGVDSSLVCAVLGQELGSKLRTFSVGFEGVPAYDERKYSRMVAERIGSQHTEIMLNPDVASVLSQVVWNHGEPFGDSSAIPSFLIAREARKHVKVVLTGDGGDEGFAGYSHYLSSHRDKWWPSWMPESARRVSSSASSMFTAAAPNSPFARRAQLFLWYLAADPRAITQEWCWETRLKNELYCEQWREQLGGWNARHAHWDMARQLNSVSAVDRDLEYTLRMALPGDYLAKVDIATMGGSIEARCPFLDLELLQFAMRIPAEALLSGHQTKSLLKKYAERFVPHEAIYRKKWGFGIPVGHWFKTTWKKPLYDLLLCKRADRGVFAPAMVRRVLDEHSSGKLCRTNQIWTLLVFEIWNQLFIDKTLTPGDPVFPAEL